MSGVLFDGVCELIEDRLEVSHDAIFEHTLVVVDVLEMGAPVDDGSTLAVVKEGDEAGCHLFGEGLVVKDAIDADTRGRDSHVCEDTDDTRRDWWQSRLGLAFEGTDDTEHTGTSGWCFGVDVERLDIEIDLIFEPLDDGRKVTDAFGVESLRVVEASEICAGVLEQRLVELVLIFLADDIDETLGTLLGFITGAREDD